MTSIVVPRPGSALTCTDERKQFNKTIPQQALSVTEQYFELSSLTTYTDKMVNLIVNISKLTRPVLYKQ